MRDNTMNSTKRTIAIVCGGDSSEYEVSLRSAEGLNSAFDHDRYEVYIVMIRKNDWHVNLPDGRQPVIDKNDFSFINDGKKICFDYAYITIHGTPGENGVLQGYFDMIELPYSTCNVLVEALTFHKFALNNYLKAFGCSVPDSIQVRRGVPHGWTAEKVKDYLGMPCFVKPTADGSSFGVSKVKNFDRLAPALRTAFMENEEVMIEGFMDGIEITQGIYKTREKTVVLPITEVVTNNEFFDYDAKYNGQVEEITPARISPELAARVSEQTSRIYDILHCNGIIRIDYILTKDEQGNDKIMMLEINTTPGMTATSFIPQQVRAAGLNITDVMTDIVENQF
jgi:D-alanine-D-alanine ligase